MTPRRRTTPHDDSTRTTDASATVSTQATTAKIQEAVEARDALAAALTRAGIQLPAMAVRTPWQDAVGGNDDSDAGSAARYALIHLGICSAPVAHALAAVIMKGADR